MIDDIGEHKFCSVCGRKNLLRAKLGGYNSETGKKEYRVFMTCPKRRGILNTILNQNHDNYVVDYSMDEDEVNALKESNKET